MGPKVKVAAKAVLYPDRLRRCPWVGKVIDLIMHAVVVGSHVWYTLFLLILPSLVGLSLIKLWRNHEVKYSKEDEHIARNDLQKICEPFGILKSFLSQ